MGVKILYVISLVKILIENQALDEPTKFVDVICLDSCAFMANKYCKTYGLSFASIENEELQLITIPNEFT